MYVMYHEITTATSLGANVLLYFPTVRYHLTCGTTHDICMYVWCQILLLLLLLLLPLLPVLLLMEHNKKTWLVKTCIENVCSPRSNANYFHQYSA